MKLSAARMSRTLLGLTIFLLSCSPEEKKPLSVLPSHGLDFAPAARPRRARYAPPAPRPAVTKRPDNAWYVKPGRKWKHIVIHHSATDSGNAAGFDKAHRSRGFEELGYHFVITNGDGGPDGNVEVGSRWRKQKWGAHTGGTPDNEYNNHGIGICLVGNFDEYSPSVKQLASLRKLLLFLCETYNVDPSNVIGHQDGPNCATACPGKHLERVVKSNLRPALMRQFD